MLRAYVNSKGRVAEIAGMQIDFYARLRESPRIIASKHNYEMPRIFSV